MSRAQPKSSPTDEHARRIAQAIAKGRPPPFNGGFDRYCESSPREIFAAFTGAARHCLRPAMMSRLRLVICSCCSGCWSIYVTAPSKAMQTRPS
jgi:hypothetical protein